MCWGNKKEHVKQSESRRHYVIKCWNAVNCDSMGRRPCILGALHEAIVLWDWLGSWSSSGTTFCIYYVCSNSKGSDLGIQMTRNHHHSVEEEFFSSSRLPCWDGLFHPLKDLALILICFPLWPVSLGLDSVLSGSKNSAVTLIKWRASQKQAGQDLWFSLFPGKPGCWLKTAKKPFTFFY